MKTRLLLLLPLLIPGAVFAQGVPDPSLSSCDFPEGSVVCTDPLTIPVMVATVEGPYAGALVQVVIIVESGSLDPGQVTLVDDITDATGLAEPTFPNGVDGNAVIHFETFANGILLCVSGSYQVTTCPVPVRPSTWGGIKSRFTSLTVAATP